MVYRFQVYLDTDAIEQRAGDPFLVATHLLGAAPALRARVAEAAAAACFHGLVAINWKTTAQVHACSISDSGGDPTRSSSTRTPKTRFAVERCC